MFPKLRRLNEFVRIHGEGYLRNFSMWHFQDHERSEDRYPQPVAPALFTEGVFLFLGKHETTSAFDPELILSDFDDLLPVYEFVEGSNDQDFPLLDEKTSFSFRPSDTSDQKYQTELQSSEQNIDVSLRHNRLQDALLRKLQQVLGSENVATELSNGIGGRIDVVARNDGRYEFYEIKVGESARSCIRQALGQLLEYGFWPGAVSPSKLVIVGEPALKEKGKAFLSKLRDDHKLPFHYLQISTPDDAEGGGRGV